MNPLIKKICLLAALLLLSTSLHAQGNAPVRLAVVVESPEVSTLADVLTVELSKNPHLQLLERAEIEKIYREQSLSAGNRDYLKLGQVLGADGLLLLTPDALAGAPSPQVRLVAVKQGVILASERPTGSIDDPTGWAQIIAHHFEPLFPKLGVLTRDALPISIVNFHSAIRSPGAEETERQLTVLTIDRLARERELFVLERRNMRSLTAENELKAVDDSAFWNGSYLLEGTLDRDSYSKDTISINARLTPPNHLPPLEIQIRASRTNLTETVNQFAAQVLKALKLGADSTPWNAGDEAKQYYDEAQWDLKWNLLPEAQRAAESAWALGEKTKAVAMLRIVSYYDEGVDTADTWYDIQQRLVLFAAGSPHRRGEFVRPVAPTPENEVAPEAVRFARVRRVMELYRDGFRNFIAADPKPGWEWHDTGIDLLEGASYWLRHYYYMPQSRAGQEDAILEVQGLAKEIVALLESHPAFTNDFGRSTFFSSKVNWGLPFVGLQTERPHRSLLETKVVWGAYWMQTPEEGVALYRGILESGNLPKVRKYFVNPDFLKIHIEGLVGGTLPPERILSYLTGWQQADRQRVLTVWHHFIEDLCSSTNAGTKAEGLFLRCAQAPADAQHDQYFRELVAFLESHQDELVTDGFSEGLAGDLDALIQARRTGIISVDAVLGERSELAKRVCQSMAAVNSRLMHHAHVVEMENYFTAGQRDRAKFDALFQNFDYQPEDVQALLPFLHSFRSNIVAELETVNTNLEKSRESLARGSADDRARLGQMYRAHGELDIFRMKLDRLDGDLTSKSKPQISPPVSSTNPAPPQNIVTSPVDSLVVTRFWPLPDRLPQADESSQLSIASWCYREGRLWVDARAMRIGVYAGQETYFNRGAFFRIDLDSLGSEAISLDPGSSELPQGALFLSSERMFEVHQGYLYISTIDKISRYSLATQKWEDLPVPIQGHGRITFIDDKMLISTADSILESTPEGKDVRILASSRRQPPVSKLDSITDYGSPPIVKGPDGSIITMVAGQLYEFPRDGKDWVLLPSSNEWGHATASTFDGGLVMVSQSPGQGERIFALPAGARAPDLLIAAQPQIIHPLDKTSNVYQPRWRFPETGQPISAVCLDGERLWVLSAESIPPRMLQQKIMQGQNGLEVTLTGFHRGNSEPLQIPLQLRLPNSFIESHRRTGIPRGPSFMEMTPKGLVIVDAGFPGFWFIPQNELVARQQAWFETRSDASK